MNDEAMITGLTPPQPSPSTGSLQLLRSPTSPRKRSGLPSRKALAPAVLTSSTYRI